MPHGYRPLVTTLFYAGATAAVLVLLRLDQVSELQGISQAGNAVQHQFLHSTWLTPVISLIVFASAVGQFGGLGSSVSRMPYAAGVDGLLPRAFGKTHPRWNTPYISMLMLGALASALLIFMQLGDTARAAYDTIVSLMVIVGFLPYLVHLRQRVESRPSLRCSSGRRRNLNRDFLQRVAPPGGVTYVWILKENSLLVLQQSIVSGWLLYRRASYRRSAAESSSKVISPG